MGKSVNQVFLLGRLTRDIEVKQTPSGKTVGSFSLAVDKQTNPQNNGPTADFFNCVAWEKTAELLSQYTSKGSRIHVQGQLQARSYEAKDGTNRNVVEINVRDFTLLDSKADAQPAPTKNNDTNTDNGDEPINLDDIPF